MINGRTHCTKINQPNVDIHKIVKILPIGPRSEKEEASCEIESTNATAKKPMLAITSAIGLNNHENKFFIQITFLFIYQ